MASRTNAPPRRSRCPLNLALELVGDAWSLLVVRDLMFNGRHTFSEMLGAEEGIATNILADRLAKLEQNGIVEKHPFPGDARRSIYRLTERGIDLAPVLVELMVWSARYEQTAAPPGQIEAMTRRRDSFLARVRESWRSDRHAGDAPKTTRVRKQAG